MEDVRCSLHSPLHVFFLIALARQCVRFGLKKMMPIQNGLPRRAIAGVGGATHRGIGANLGEGEVLSVGQPGSVAKGNVTSSGGNTHSWSCRDIEAVNIEHCARLTCARSCWRGCP
jgi:hypothetical protein